MQNTFLHKLLKMPNTVLSREDVCSLKTDAIYMYK